MNDITILLPTGRMQSQCLEIFNILGFINDELDRRKYIFYDQKNKIKFLMVKPSDIIQLMNAGIGDLCFIGSDLLLNQTTNNLEKIIDLNFGLCSMVIACKDNEDFINPKSLIGKTIATKYSEFVINYFNSLNIPTKVVKMNGTVELAPNIGIADAIIDIKETGNTLKANNLKDFYTICDINMTLAINKEKKYLLKEERFKSLIKEIKLSSSFLYGDNLKTNKEDLLVKNKQLFYPNNK